MWSEEESTVKKGRRWLYGVLSAVLSLSLAVACPILAGAEKGETEDEALLAAHTAAAETADKAETVYVRADAAGKAEQVTVETVLDYAGDGAVIEDRTNLSDIKNTEGDEEYTLGEDGALRWEDHGEKIRYEGKSDAALPVTVTVRYELDGERILPEALAGRSGHLCIRFDYDNHTGAGGETPVPFLALSMCLLPEEVFSHVQVTNGRLLSLGEQTLAVGYAFPGLSEALTLSDTGLTEDVEIPEFVGIEADVTDFSLDFTATVVSNGLLGEIGEGDLNDLADLSDGMSRLSDASARLTEGARQLAAGSGGFQSALNTYVDAISDGTQQLSDGLARASQGAAPLRQGAAAVDQALAELRKALDGRELPDREAAADALRRVIDGIDTLRDTMEALPVDAAAVSGAMEAADSALAGIDLDVSGALSGLDLTDEQRAQVAAAVEGSLSDARTRIAQARQALADAPEGGTEAELAQYAAALDEAAGVIRAQAEAALGQLDTLPAAPEEALAQLSELSAGVTALCDGIDSLSQGADRLSRGAAAGTQLKDAASRLTRGAGGLADGMAQFDAEGIAQLSDLAGGDLGRLTDQLRRLRERDLRYDNFGGICPGRSGSVRFVIETAAIGK
jgi:putative membrane protein